MLTLLAHNNVLEKTFQKVIDYFGYQITTNYVRVFQAQRRTCLKKDCNQFFVVPTCHEPLGLINYIY